MGKNFVLDSIHGPQNSTISSLVQFLFIGMTLIMPYKNGGDTQFREREREREAKRPNVEIVIQQQSQDTCLVHMRIEWKKIQPFGFEFLPQCLTLFLFFFSLSLSWKHKNQRNDVTLLTERHGTDQRASSKLRTEENIYNLCITKAENPNEQSNNKIHQNLIQTIKPMLVVQFFGLLKIEFNIFLC